MRVFYALAGTILTLTALVGAAGFWYWRQLTTPLAPPPGGAVVSVAPGEAFQSVCGRLEEAGIVRRGWVLQWWARWSGEDRLVRAGDYLFRQPLSPLDVIDVLQAPGTTLNRVTIPEGQTVWEVAEIMEKAGLGGADEFLCLANNAEFLASLKLPASGLEGYLFPDTYDFAWATPPADIIRLMVEHFRQEVGPLQHRREESGMSEEDMVILASIIESETGAANERAVISGVFHNRLRIGMRLQADPTAVYERGAGRPSADDLKVDSPYNTYIYAGLPPGPICNPGLAALEAAIDPANVPYMYFVAKKDGTHIFSRTLDEHTRAIAAARRSTP